MIKKIKIAQGSEDQRLDKYLKRLFSNLSQSFIEKNLRKKNILINGLSVKSKYLVNKNDLIIIKNYSEEVYATHEPQRNFKKVNKTQIKNFKDSIVFDNDNFIVINKWCRISTQGGTNITISIDAIIKTISTNYNLVHRLDKDTPGVFIMAKTRESAQLLTSLFRLRKVHKTYLAICHGELDKDSGEWNDDLIRYDGDKRISEKAKTIYKVLDKNSEASLVELKPITGRKHQLRKQLYALGQPIFGDIKYKLSNSSRGLNKNLMLHSYQIKFIIDDVKHTYTALLPDYFRKLLKTKRLRFSGLK